MSDENAPNIAEKVRFWEEQDRINQALIPRVLEMNDVVKNAAASLSTVDTRIAASEARVRKTVYERIATSERRLTEKATELVARGEQRSRAMTLEAVSASEKRAADQADKQIHAALAVSECKLEGYVETRLAATQAIIQKRAQKLAEDAADGALQEAKQHVSAAVAASEKTVSANIEVRVSSTETTILHRAQRLDDAARETAVEMARSLDDELKQAVVNYLTERIAELYSSTVQPLAGDMTSHRLRLDQLEERVASSEAGIRSYVATVVSEAERRVREEPNEPLAAEVQKLRAQVNALSKSDLGDLGRALRTQLVVAWCAVVISVSAFILAIVR